MLGAGGSIGSQICKTIINKHNPKQLRCFDNCEYNLFRLLQEIEDKHDNVRMLIGDICDKERLARAFDDVDVVIHAAALKHVAMCEYNPDQAVRVNVMGTQNVVELAKLNNVEHALFISTDKAVNPTSVMGTTKLLGEKLFLSAPSFGKARTKFSIVRFGNVFGSSGSVAEIFYDKILNEQEILITDEKATRYLMSIENAVDLILQTIKYSNGNQIYVLRMKKINIAHLANVISKVLDKKMTYRVTGLKIGEKLHEDLMTEYEKETCAITDKYHIISHLIKYPHFDQEEIESEFPSSTKEKVEKTREMEEYFSDEEIQQMILEYGEKRK